MEIQNHGKNLKVHLPPQDSAKSNRSANSVESGNGVDQPEQVNPKRLLERLHGDAKVRERLLVEIEAKVQSGEYLTRAAAVNAAEQIADL